jgi:hypothetical protein
LCWGGRPIGGCGPATSSELGGRHHLPEGRPHLWTRSFSRASGGHDRQVGTKDEVVTFRPDGDLEAQAAALHTFAIEHDWFKWSQGCRTDSVMQAFTWTDLITLLSTRPGA